MLRRPTADLDGDGECAELEEERLMRRALMARFSGDCIAFLEAEKDKEDDEEEEGEVAVAAASVMGML